MKKRIAHLAFGLSFAVPHLCSAALHTAASEDELFDLPIEDLLNITITGSTLTEETLASVPSSVSVFHRQDFSRMGVDTLEELMNYVPGFQQFRQGENSLGQNYASRGRMVGASSREVLILIDGQRIDNPFAGGSTPVYSQIQLANFDKIEFIRGTGSAIYGANAFLGVVNITTVSAMNEANLAVGSNDHYSGHIMAGHNFEQADASVNAYLRYAQDSGERFNVPDTFSSSRVDTTDNKKLADIQLKTHWNQTRLQIAHYARDTHDFYVTGSVANDINKSNSNLTLVALEQDITFTEHYTNQLKLHYSQMNWALSTQILPAGALAGISTPTSNDPAILETDIKMQDIHVIWHHDFTLSEAHQIQGGLEYRYAHADETYLTNNFDIGQLSQGDLPINFYDPMESSTLALEESKQDISSLYLQYQFRPSQLVDFHLSGRYDHFSRIGDKISPRAAVIIHPNTSDSFKFLYGRAFRAPTFNELYTINNPIIEGNPNLRPETVDTFEIIWVSQRPTSYFSLSYFHNTYQDAIAETVNQTPRTYINNEEKEKSQGVELEIVSRFLPDWELRTSLTSLFQNTPSAYRLADSTFSAALNYNLPDWNFNLATFYHIERDYPVTGDDDTATLEGYWMTNFKGIYCFHTQWETYLQVNNLFDEQYATPALSTGVTEGIPNRGREVRLGLTWHFR